MPVEGPDPEGVAAHLAGKTEGVDGAAAGLLPGEAARGHRHVGRRTSHAGQGARGTHQRRVGHPTDRGDGPEVDGDAIARGKRAEHAHVGGPCIHPRVVSGSVERADIERRVEGRVPCVERWRIEHRRIDEAPIEVDLAASAATLRGAARGHLGDPEEGHRDQLTAREREQHIDAAPCQLGAARVPRAAFEPIAAGGQARGHGGDVVSPGFPRVHHGAAAAPARQDSPLDHRGAVGQDLIVEGELPLQGAAPGCAARDHRSDPQHEAEEPSDGEALPAEPDEPVGLFVDHSVETSLPRWYAHTRRWSSVASPPSCCGPRPS